MLGVGLLVIALNNGNLPWKIVERKPTSQGAFQPLVIELDTDQLYRKSLSEEAHYWLSRSRWVQFKFWERGARVVAVTNSKRQRVGSLFRGSPFVLSDYLYLREGPNKLYIQLESSGGLAVFYPLEIEYSP